jgi:hypothetical protein
LLLKTDLSLVGNVTPFNRPFSKGYNFSLPIQLPAEAFLEVESLMAFHMVLKQDTPFRATMA